CFWSRRDGAKPGALAALDQLLAQASPAAKGVFVVAVAARQALLFPKEVLGRELAQRDLIQWLQRLQDARWDTQRAEAGRNRKPG
ncbi:unnamed protein product, partial [Effrenium voratum]